VFSLDPVDLMAGDLPRAQRRLVDQKHVSTGYVERQNVTMRMSMRRFTRLTNAFSKKLENHAAMVAFYFMYLQLRPSASDAQGDARNGSQDRGSRMVNR